MGILSDRQIERLAKLEGMIAPYSPMEKRKGVISYGVSSMGYDVRIGYKFRVFRSYPHDEIDPKNFNPELLEEVDLTPADHDWQRMKVPRLFSIPETDSDYDKCSFCGKEEHKDEHGYEQGRDNSCGKSTPNFIRIPPHSFALGESVEYFKIPRDILVVVLGKSTYARTGLIVNVTPGEPEWDGIWTIEMSNTTPLPIRVYAGEGIMQCLFFRSDERRALLESSFLAERSDESKEWEEAVLSHAGCGVSYKDKKGKYQDQQGVTLPKVD